MTKSRVQFFKGLLRGNSLLGTTLYVFAYHDIASHNKLFTSLAPKSAYDASFAVQDWVKS